MPVSPQDVDKAHISKYNAQNTIKEIDAVLMEYGTRERCTVTTRHLSPQIANTIRKEYQNVGWIVDVEPSWLNATVFTFQRVRREVLPPPKKP